MADDAAIRRANLVRLLKTPEQAARAMPEPPRRYSYWRDLMHDPKKSFGEKVARSIEEQMGWPRGSLDVPDFEPGERVAPILPSGTPVAAWRESAFVLATQVEDEDTRAQLIRFLLKVDAHTAALAPAPDTKKRESSQLTQDP